MSSVLDNYNAVIERVNESALKAGKNPSDITLVAVSKTFPLEMIKEAFLAGARIFGENYIQEAIKKVETFDENVCWHFIGHLQRNKVKYAVGKFDLIEAVDSCKLCKEIDKRSSMEKIVQDILLEVNISGEDSKNGFTQVELSECIQEISSLKNIRVKGLMTIPPYGQDGEESRKYFVSLRELMFNLNSENISGIEMTELSMGMSSDYEVAIEEGATIVRVGSSIFGRR